jgi:hypothetical protein
MDEENVRKRIRTILDELHNEADPRLLNRYRSVFRKEVSFFRRSYFAAYLLLLDQEGKPAARPKKESRHERRESAEEAHVLEEEESARLFVSIGRNRKVFPREILGLINSRAHVAREDIGTIRILDSYSFVQVRTAAAPAIIGALNGQSFRGRTLTVSYARVKKDDPGDCGPAVND